MFNPSPDYFRIILHDIFHDLKNLRQFPIGVIFEIDVDRDATSKMVERIPRPSTILDLV